MPAARAVASSSSEVARGRAPRTASSTVDAARIMSATRWEASNSGSPSTSTREPTAWSRPGIAATSRPPGVGPESQPHHDRLVHRFRNETDITTEC